MGIPETNSIASVIGYGVAFGAVNGFLMPARDTLLSRIAGSNIVRAVTAMTMVQFPLYRLITVCALGSVAMSRN